MALFKLLKGKSANLPSEKHEGYAYFVTDTGEFYIDIDNNTRVQVNAGKLSKTIDGETFELELENIVDIDDLNEHNTTIGAHTNEKWLKSKDDELQGSEIEKTLTENGTAIIPKTTASAVKMSDGTTVEESMNKKINKVIPSENNNVALLDTNGNIIDGGKQLEELGKKTVFTSVNLNSALWSTETQTQVASVSGVTASNLITVSPTQPEIALKYGVYCSKQSINTLEFKYLVKPNEDIAFNIFIEEL